MRNINVITIIGRLSSEHNLSRRLLDYVYKKSIKKIKK